METGYHTRGNATDTNDSKRLQGSIRKPEIRFSVRTWEDKWKTGLNWSAIYKAYKQDNCFEGPKNGG